MKRIFLSLFLFAAITISTQNSFAQGTPKPKAKTPAKTTAKTPAKTVAAVKPAASTAEFNINGTVTGFNEGATVELLNGQTGATELSTILKAGKFSFKGKMERPEFKIVLFNRQQPYITVFLDNSNVTITGDKATIDKSKVIGSPSHTAFEQFNNSLEPYQSVFAPDGEYDSAMLAKAMNLIHDFVTTHKDSYITPLAVIRYNQIADDVVSHFGEHAHPQDHLPKF